MKCFFSLLAVLIFVNGYSQECSKDLLAAKPGIFKPGMGGSIHNVTATDLAREKALLNTIFNKIKGAYSPTGCEANYNFVFGKNLNAGVNWKADPYYHSQYLLRFLCDSHDPNHIKYYVDVETPTVVTVAANVVYGLNTLWAAGIPSDDLREYLKLDRRPELIDGYLYMGDFPMNNNSTVRELVWMITYSPDSLPFSYVSRKEYLGMERKRLLKDMKDSPSEVRYFQGFIDRIDQYLTSSSATELNEPACCMWNQEERFENFVPEGTQGSFIAVKPNLSYYHKNLPLSSPQFFSVSFKYAKEEPVFVKNIEALKKAIDFNELHKMLGK